MQQTWHDLLFAHWPLPVESIRSLVPQPMTLDTYEGKCWIGVIPFRMSGIHRRGFPPLPGLSCFPELNVRTYVKHNGKAGVYFFSLDAASLPAVWAARRFYHLPYFHASMTSQASDGSIHYYSRRHGSAAEFRGHYAPSAEARLRDKGTIEHWFTERYCLFTTFQNQIYRREIHHRSWPLQDAEAEIEIDTMAAAAQVSLPETKPLLHFARKLEVLIWPLTLAE